MALVRATQQTALPTVRGLIGELKKLTREAASAPAFSHSVVAAMIAAINTRERINESKINCMSGTDGGTSWGIVGDISFFFLN